MLLSTIIWYLSNIFWCKIHPFGDLSETTKEANKGNKREKRIERITVNYLGKMTMIGVDRVIIVDWFFLKINVIHLIYSPPCSRNS